MKTLLPLLSIAFLSTASFAADEAAICEKLYNKAITRCEIQLCAEWATDEGKVAKKSEIKECLESADGDLMEGAQICAIDGGMLKEVIAKYNLKHPKQTVKCEDY